MLSFQNILLCIIGSKVQLLILLASHWVFYVNLGSFLDWKKKCVFGAGSLALCYWL